MTSRAGERPYAWRVSAFYTWLGRHPGMVDGVPAVVLAFLGMGQSIALGRYSLVPVLLVLITALAFRRRFPVEAFVTGIVAGAVQVLLRIRPNIIDIAIVILLYTLAAYRPRRLSVPGLGICLTGSAVAVAVWRPVETSLLNWLMVGAIIFAGPTLIAWVLGDSMQYRRAYYVALEDRATRLERERDQQAQIAAATERARIARELHDVVAHNVSVMVVQAEGAAYAMDTAPDEPGRRSARSPTPAGPRWPRCAGCSACCAPEDGVAERAPQPGVANSRTCWNRCGRPGCRWTSRRGGAGGAAAGRRAGRVPDRAGVADQRAQARRPGGQRPGGAALLRGRAACCSVTDDGRGAQPPTDGQGNGLAGMRERVAMFGGALNAGRWPAAASRSAGCQSCRGRARRRRTARTPVGDGAA